MSNPADPFEFVKNLWGQMGIPGFGAAAAGAPGMPTFAPEELEKRLGELKQVKQWLEVNLNMMGLQINGLEMQLAAIKGFKSSPGAEFVAQAADAMRGHASAPPAVSASHAAPPVGQTSWTQPFWTQPPMAEAPPPAPEPVAKTMAWPDPAAWMQNLQTEFAKSMKAVAPNPVPAKKAAPAKTGAGKSAAARKTAAKRPRNRP